MGYEVKYKDSKLRINFVRRGNSIHYYSVELLEGDWPSDHAIITLCDGDDPEKPACHFGGHVAKCGKQANVDVYVD